LNGSSFFCFSVNSAIQLSIFVDIMFRSVMLAGVAAQAVADKPVFELFFGSA